MSKLMKWRRRESDGALALFLNEDDKGWVKAELTRHHTPNTGFQVSDGWATYQSLRKQGWLLVDENNKIVGR